MEFDDFDDLFGGEKFDDDDNDGNEKKADAVDDKTKILDSAWVKIEDDANKSNKARVKRIQPKLTEKELTSDKGLPALKELLDNYQFPHEANPYGKLDFLLGKVECWAHNLFPQMNFDDCLEKIERLGHKRMVKNTMKRLRLGIPLNDDVDDGKEASDTIEKDGDPESYWDEMDGFNEEMELWMKDEKYTSSTNEEKKEQNSTTIGSELWEQDEEWNLTTTSNKELEPQMEKENTDMKDVTPESDEDEPLPKKVKKRRILIDDDEEE